MQLRIGGVAGPSWSPTRAARPAQRRNNGRPLPPAGSFPRNAGRQKYRQSGGRAPCPYVASGGENLLVVVAQGVKLGRPKIDSATERKVRKQLAKGVGILKVAK